MKLAPDQWLIRWLVRLFLARYINSLGKEWALIHEAGLDGQIERLKQRIGKCGRGVDIRAGIHVTMPERLTLGDRVGIGENCFIGASGGVHIGDYTQLANNVIITTINHQVGGIYYGSVTYHPVVIRENVWIGSGVIILPGVTIGENSIIGAGAVVSRDIPANKVALGIPARVVKDVPFDPVLRQQHLEGIAAGTIPPKEVPPVPPLAES